MSTFVTKEAERRCSKEDHLVSFRKICTEGRSTMRDTKGGGRLHTPLPWYKAEGEPYRDCPPRSSSVIPIGF